MNLLKYLPIPKKIFPVRNGNKDLEEKVLVSPRRSSRTKRFLANTFLALGLATTGLCCGDSQSEPIARVGVNQDDDDTDYILGNDDGGDDTEYSIPTTTTITPTTTGGGSTTSTINSNSCGTINESFGGSWSCNDPFACFCSEDYTNFINDTASEYALPISEENLIEHINYLMGQPFLQDPIPRDEFKEKLIDALNIRFLIEDLDNRNLEARVISDTLDGPYRKREIVLKDLFGDEVKGTYSVLEEKENSGVSLPALVALPGHSCNDDCFFNIFGGRELVDAGYALFAISSKVMCGGESEDSMTRNFSRNGFNFLGIQIYETLLARKYMGCLSNIDSERIGLDGHSGGSTTNEVTARVAYDKFKAFVSDNRDCFLCHPYNEPVLSYYTPDLKIYQELIYNHTTSSIPTLDVLYGRENISEIIAFYNQHLNNQNNKK